MASNKNNNINNDGGGNNNTLLIIAIIAVIVSIVGFFVVLDLNINIIQFAQHEGTAQVTIVTDASIRMSHNIINWGSGFIVPPTGTALLNSEGTRDFFPAGTIVTEGFIAENIGNVPLVLEIEASESASSFLVGDAGATFQYRVNNCFTGVGPYDCEGTPVPGLIEAADTGEACLVAQQNPDLLVPNPWAGYRDMPPPATRETLCGVLLGGGMTFVGTNDEIEINIQISFDVDATPGARSAIITLTVTDASP